MINAILLAAQTGVKVKNTIPAAQPVASHTWIYIILAVVVVLAILVAYQIYHIKHSQNELTRKKVLNEGNINFNATIQSAFHSSEIYDQLKVKCHPDRFVDDPEKMKMADALFQQISKNKNNYKRLLELKAEAEQKLNVKF